MIFRRNLNNPECLTAKLGRNDWATVVRWRGKITFANHDTKGSMYTIVSLFRSMASGVMTLVMDLS
jgi:hypothetical protein